MAKKLSLSGPAGIVAIVTSVMLTLVSVLLAAGFTVLLGYTLAQAFSGKSISGQLGGLFFLAIGMGGCESLRVAIEQRCQLSEQGALQSRLLWHIFRIGPGILAQRRVGSLIDMMTAGTEKIERYRQGFLGSMIGSMLTPPLVLVLMALFIDPICALVLLAFVPLVPLIIFVFSKLTRKVSGKSRRQRNQLAAAYLDTISGLETLTLVGASEVQGEKLAAAGEKNRLSTMRLLAANQLILLVIDMGFNLLLLTSGFALCLWRVLSGAWGTGVGVIAPMISMLGLTLLLLEPMNSIGAFFYIGMAGKANQRLVRRFLGSKTSLAAPEIAPDTGLESSENSDLDRRQAESEDEASANSILSSPVNSNQSVSSAVDPDLPLIQMQGINFAYPGGKPVLKNLDLTVEKGEWVAICGASGEGKSTLIEMIKGNLLPNSGQVYLQGQSLTPTNRDWFRARSALLQQTTWVFSGTIRSNLMMVAPRASEERLWDCLKKVKLGEEVRSFPKGLDTTVGEDAYALSGGQAQRLSLARALLSERDLLLLDEPTSQIDLASEAAIIQALAEIAKEKTLLLLTHRASALRYADRVLYLKDGALREVSSE